MSIKTILCDFTDQYGIAHPSAVCFINAANKTESRTEALYYDESAKEVSKSDGTYNSVSYTVGYWHDEKARTAGAKILTLNGANLPATTFSLDESYKGLTLEQACLRHFQEHVLPTKSA